MLVVMTALLYLFSAGLVNAASYEFTAIDYPGASQTEAFALNDLDHIAGAWSVDRVAPWGVMPGNPKGFIWQNGNFITLEFPGSTQTIPTGLNRNCAVGLMDRDGATRSFKYCDAARSWEMLQLNGGALDTYVIGIDDNNEIVGEFSMAIASTSRRRQAGYRFDGNFEPVDPRCPADAPADSSSARAKNHNGGIAGWVRCGGAINGFISHDNGRTFTLITVPNSAAGTTIVYGINDAGDVTGAYHDATGERCFMLSDGVFTAIDFPGAKHTACYGINNNKTLSGAYVDSNNKRHAFIAKTTQPLLATLTQQKAKSKSNKKKKG
jgi:hypothetical protein